MDDPLPGSCLASLELSWNLGILLAIAALASMFFSYIYFLLNNFSGAKLLQLCNNHGSRKHARMESYLEHLPRTFNTVVTIEITAKIIFILATYSVLLRSGESAEKAIEFTPLLWTFLIGAVWFIFFCRAIPAELGSHREEAILKRLLPVLNAIGLLFLPVHALLGPFQNTVARTFSPADPEAETDQYTEEIIEALEEGEREGVIREEVADMIENIIELRDVDVADIMTPRTDMKAAQTGLSLKEAVKIAMDEGHSRIPVFKEDHDHIVGILYLKDVLKLWLDDPTAAVPLESIARKPYFIPETKKVSELLREFREEKIHIAIVLDEYGGTAGLATNEDILEEIVGEIVDEYDREEEIEIREIEERILDVSGKVHVSEINKEWGTVIPESNDFETLGGFIFAHLGRVPRQGETVEVGNSRLTVTDVGERRINRITVELLEED